MILVIVWLFLLQLPLFIFYDVIIRQSPQVTPFVMTTPCHVAVFGKKIPAYDKRSHVIHGPSVRGHDIGGHDIRGHNMRGHDLRGHKALPATDMNQI